MNTNRLTNVKIEGNEIVLDFIPRKDVQEGLKIFYCDWFQEPKSTLPIAITTLYKGQDTYTLPEFLQGLAKWRILQIDAVDFVRHSD